MATVSELITERQRSLSQGWTAFLEHPLHPSIAQIIERKNTNLPSKYVPWAPAIAVASNPLLEAARRAPVFALHKLWGKHPRYGYFYNCEVRIVRRTGFWFIERDDLVLVYRFGSMPFCTRTQRDAIALFEHLTSEFDDWYDPPLGPRGHGLHWVKKTPNGILVC